MILEQFPSIEDFYQTYWNRRPFVVRGGVDQGIFEHLIDGDTLAGLSMEEDVKSRIVMTSPESDKGNEKWTCAHGPFDEDYFETLGATHWSLLVQNVEQYHPDTAKLLQSFRFAPRWLMDDIMVSYSEAGGSVGPHTDSYHVFLVQGQGRRQWTIGREALTKEDCIEGLELKVLKDGVTGETVEVSTGDVIYLPPHFAHEGVTLEESLTFSVGFLGPRLSDLMIEYGHYLAEREENDTRYSGRGLDEKSASFTISMNEQQAIQNDLSSAIKSDNFSAWLSTYFSTPTHDDAENIELRAEELSADEVVEQLTAGGRLYCPDHVKLAVTMDARTHGNGDGAFNLSAYGALFKLPVNHEAFVDALNQGHDMGFEDIKSLGGIDVLSEIITALYNHNVLFFEGEDLV